MDYRIMEYTAYDEQEVLPLYKSVGWTNYTNNTEMLKEAYRHSLKAYAAYSNERLVGLIRVVGDGFPWFSFRICSYIPSIKGKGSERR